MASGRTRLQRDLALFFSSALIFRESNLARHVQHGQWHNNCNQSGWGLPGIGSLLISAMYQYGKRMHSMSVRMIRHTQTHMNTHTQISNLLQLC